MHIKPAQMSMRCLFALPIALFAVGCSSEDDSRTPTHPISGQVFFKGQPAEGAQVLFFFNSEHLRGQVIPTPKATVDENGDFQIGCYGDDDGAPAGEYRVAIVWEENLPVAVRGEDEDPPDRLGGRYANPQQSGLTATIAEGKNTLPPYQLK